MPALNCLDFAATFTAFSCSFTYTRYNERRFLFAAPANINCKI